MKKFIIIFLLIFGTNTSYAEHGLSGTYLRHFKTDYFNTLRLYVVENNDLGERHIVFSCMAIPRASGKLSVSFGITPSKSTYGIDFPFIELLTSGNEYIKISVLKELNTPNSAKEILNILKNAEKLSPSEIAYRHDEINGIFQVRGITLLSDFFLNWCEKITEPS